MMIRLFTPSDCHVVHGLISQALLSVFKGRASEKDKDTAVERCEVELHEGPEQTECRLVVRRLCGLGKAKN